MILPSLAAGFQCGATPHPHCLVFTYSISDRRLKKSMIRCLRSHCVTDVLHYSFHVKSCAEFTAERVYVWYPRGPPRQMCRSFLPVQVPSLLDILLCRPKMSCLVLLSLIARCQYRTVIFRATKLFSLQKNNTVSSAFISVLL